MTLKDFVRNFDKENKIILLEGKRTVLDEDKDKLVQLGKILASKTKNMKFRSGNAEGADYYFSLGVSSIDKTRLQVITPYSGHRKKTNQANETISLEDINLAFEPKVISQSRSHIKIAKLIDPYLSGKRDQFSMKAAYIIRDTIKAIGTAEIQPADFGIFYDDLKNPRTGGTGHTMNICQQNGIPIISQKTWFRWLTE